mgnify:FL=1
MTLEFNLFQCRVHDYYLSGMMQPLLGTFSLDLKEFLRKAKERIDQKAKEIEGKKALLFPAEYE